MATVIEIEDVQAQALAHRAALENRTHAEILRDALDEYLGRERPARSAAFRAAFGLWGDLEVDGVEYQRRLRDEWPD